jgi:hypothetical protein
MSDHYYPPFPCCGGLTMHRGGLGCDEYRAGPEGPYETEPAPLPPIWELVMADMRERDRIGAERYGDRLRVTTAVDPLRYAYEEALDLACYLRKAIAERDGK